MCCPSSSIGSTVGRSSPFPKRGWKGLNRREALHSVKVSNPPIADCGFEGGNRGFDPGLSPPDPVASLQGEHRIALSTEAGHSDGSRSGLPGIHAWDTHDLEKDQKTRRKPPVLGGCRRIPASSPAPCPSPVTVTRSGVINRAQPSYLHAERSACADHLKTSDARARETHSEPSELSA